MPGKRLIALGWFDGVHIGHQHLLSTGHKIAAAAALRLSAYTFPPRNESLLPLEAKGRLLGGLVDEVIVVPWEEVKDIPAEEFVQAELVGRLSTAGIVLGPDHRFGRGRAGDFSLLKKLSTELGFSVHMVEPMKLGGEVVSSYRIRALIKEGRVEEAASLLGRPPVLFGRPTRGAGLATAIGFPTVNIDLFPELVRPLDGVYAAWAYWPGGVGNGLFYIGKRPTFPDLPPTAEVHLFSSPTPAPSGTIEVHLIARLRGDEKFPNAKALAAQIARDRGEARNHLAVAPVPILMGAE